MGAASDHHIATLVAPHHSVHDLAGRIVSDFTVEYSSKRKRCQARQGRATIVKCYGRSRSNLTDEAFLNRKVIDQRTYERQRDHLREHEALAEVDLAEATGEELDVKAILAFVEQVLGDATRLWEQATLDQEASATGVFSKGLRFDGSEFGTAVTCLAFAHLPASQVAENGVASPTGADSNRLIAWLREMGALRRALAA